MRGLASFVLMALRCQIQRRVSCSVWDLTMASVGQHRQPVAGATRTPSRTKTTYPSNPRYRDSTSTFIPETNHAGQSLELTVPFTPPRHMFPSVVCGGSSTLFRLVCIYLRSQLPAVVSVDLLSTPQLDASSLSPSPAALIERYNRRTPCLTHQRIAYTNSSRAGQPWRNPINLPCPVFRSW
ncbi:hypothetical protein AB1N83_007453 [Pleurotus pulmonarius]